MAKVSLTFARWKRQMKKSREWFPQSKNWTYSDWCMATGGEMGELFNFLKKHLRGDKTWEEVKPDVEKEIADVLIYLHRLSDHLGIDLEAALISKFNEVSKKKKSKIRL